MKRKQWLIGVVSGMALLLGTAPMINAATSVSDSKTSSASSWLSSIDMLTKKIGFATGYTGNRFSFWSTSDGGLDWDHFSVPYVPTALSSTTLSVVTQFQSQKVGWVSWIELGKTANTLFVLRTTTGGRIWEKYETVVPQNVASVEQISFSTSKDVWIRAVSEGAMQQADTTIYHSDNAGQSWTLVSAATGYIPDKQATPDALPEFDVPMPMVFTSATEGWVAVGNVIITQDSKATLYHTTTSGRRWQPVNLPVPKALKYNFSTIEYQPVFSGDAGTLLVDHSANNTSYLVSYHTVNGGKYWTVGAPLLLNQQSYFFQESFANPETGWIIGETSSAFMRTLNHGNSWSHLSVGGSLEAALKNGYTVTRLEMVSSDTGWMLLQNSSTTNSSILLKTTDGGKTWTVQHL